MKVVLGSAMRQHIWAGSAQRHKAIHLMARMTERKTPATHNPLGGHLRTGRSPCLLMPPPSPDNAA